MDKISKVTLENITSSAYIRPMRMHFDQNGRQRFWDLMKVHDSVATLLFHKDRQSFVFVKQFRPAVYITHIPKEAFPSPSPEQCPPAIKGMTYELCAGIVDKDKDLKEIAQEEILEEVGFNVPLDQITKITSFRSGVGTSSSIQTLFYAEIEDSLKVSEGGGNELEQEMIEVVFVPVDKGEEIVFNEGINRPPAFCFSIMWFLKNKWKPSQE